MKTKLKVAGLYLLMGLILAGTVICVINFRKDVAFALGAIVCALFGIMACRAYHMEFLIEETDEYRAVRRHDIVDTKEVNVRFYVERKFLDLFTKEDIWRRASNGKEKQEEACEIIENIKKGIPIDKENIKEVVTCK